MTGRIILAAVALAMTTLPGATYAQDAKLIEKGQKVYASNKCATCHSVADKGNKKGPLDDIGTKLSADETREWLLHPNEMAAKVKSTRKPPMKSYEKLAKDDIEALVAYMQSLKKK